MRILMIAALVVAGCTADPAEDPTPYDVPFWGDPCHVEPSKPGAIVTCVHQDDGAGKIDGLHPATLGLCAPATAVQMASFPAWTDGLELHGVCRPFCDTDGAEHYTCALGSPVVVAEGGWCYCEPT